MCVWSEKSKDILIKNGNFPDNVPIVTGDPKIDFLPKAIKQFNRENICKKLKILPETKVIVFATQPFSNIEEKELIVTSVFKSIDKFR